MALHICPEATAYFAVAGILRWACKPSKRRSRFKVEILNVNCRILIRCRRTQNIKVKDKNAAIMITSGATL